MREADTRVCRRRPHEPVESPDVIGASFQAAEAADVCLVVGTSALVHPAASIPAATVASGGVVVEVNLEATPLSGPDTVSVFGPAGSILPALLAP